MYESGLLYGQSKGIAMSVLRDKAIRQSKLQVDSEKGAE
jgi:hypothetical protein